MTKLDDYARRLVIATNEAYANGFEAGKKSTLAPVSVTGRWWQAKNGEIFFIYPGQYVIYERITENNPNNSRWLSDEETREFT